MIRVRLTMTDDTTKECEFNNYNELFNYLSMHNSTIQTMEVDVEDSNNNRPAFWCEKR